MVAYVKENIRPTTGGAGTAFEIQDGTAAGNASVGAVSTYNPLATDNPLLVRAIIGDEAAIADLLAIGAAQWNPATEWTVGARNLLLDGAVLMGCSVGGGNTDLRFASVLDGFYTVPNTADNPVLVSQGLNTPNADQDGGQVAVGAAASTVLAAANADRRYLEIKNDSGNALFIALGGAAAATDFELPDGSSWYMAAPAIFTGQVQGYIVAGGNVNVIEY